MVTQSMALPDFYNGNKRWVSITNQIRNQGIFISVDHLRQQEPSTSCRSEEYFFCVHRIAVY
jgi:hypothetical protein